MQHCIVSLNDKAVNEVEWEFNLSEDRMNTIKILTSSTCGYCYAAKKLLQQQGISDLEIDLIKDNEQGQQLLSLSGRRTVPQIFINGKPIGGFTELSQMLNRKDFDVSQLTTF